MEFLVKGLHLIAKLEDHSVVGPGFAIKPLAQDAGGGIGAAGEFRIGVEGVAQVRGPLVVSGLSPLDPIQNSGSLGVFLLAVLDAQDIDGHHNAEQQYRQQGDRNTDSNHFLNALSHTRYTCFLYCSQFFCQGINRINLYGGTKPYQRIL